MDIHDDGEPDAYFDSLTVDGRCSTATKINLEIGMDIGKK